jgi:hypothetical protein
MTWLNANDHLAIDVFTRDRVEELRATGAGAHQREGRDQTTAGVLGAHIALVLGVFGLAVASGVGCATGVRAGAGGTGGSEAAVGEASPGAVQPEIPDCRGRGSYNRAANLCVSEGS